MTVSHMCSREHRVLIGLGVIALIATIAFGVSSGKADASPGGSCLTPLCIPPPPPTPDLDLAPEKTAEIIGDVSIGIVSAGIGAGVSAVTALTPAAPAAPYLGPGVGIITNVALDQAGVDDAIEDVVRERVTEPVEEIVEEVASIPDKIDYSCSVSNRLLRTRICP